MADIILASIAQAITEKVQGLSSFSIDIDADGAEIHAEFDDSKAIVVTNADYLAAAAEFNQLVAERAKALKAPINYTPDDIDDENH